MTQTSRRVVALLSTLIVLLIGVAEAGQQTIPPNGTTLPGEAWRQTVSTAAPGQRGFPVLVRFDLLRELMAGAGSILELPLDDNLRVRAAIALVQSDPTGTFLAGPLVDGAEGEASLTLVGDTLSGRIVANGRLFVVRPGPNSNVHLVSEVLQDSLPPEAQPRAPLPVLGAVERQMQVPSADSNALVDLMILYTPAARAAIGGTPAMVAELTGAVNIANLALANAGVIHRYRLVHNEEIAYLETGSINTSLSQLTFTGDGHLDYVQALRNVHRADVVTLLTTDSDACGLGWLMGPGNVNASFEAYAYNVVLWSCANANLTMAHEIGHNMGLHHDPPNAVGSSPSFPYAYGYAVPGVARDVMAYACVGPACPRRTIYSTPLFNFPGLAVAAGTASQDNARALNGTSLTVANFRQSACAYTLASISATIGPGGGSASVGVTATAGCPWTATSNSPSFLTVSGGSSGSGNGTVSYSVVANSGVARSGTLTIAGQTFTVMQAPLQTTSGDFDGDGRAEIAVFRPSTGVWYIRGTAGFTWGGGTDIPVVGDYDGDRRVDVAVFRPSTGQWFILQSSTATGLVTTWGGGGDIPVAGDYDGDGRTDLAVFRPSTGAWYILRSSTQTGSVATWGGGADVPVARDYDADGKTDIAVFRPSTGTWFILQSSTQTGISTLWGGGGDIPVAADYDHDGKADVAVFRPSTGAWFILRSSTQTGSVTTWGGGADVPVPGDYDGDGLADIAVFRPSTGAWFIIQSSTATGVTITWGGGADIPVLKRP